MGSGNPELLCEVLAARGQLLKQLEGLRVDTAWTRPEPNEWSVAEVLQHVVHVDRLYLRRIADVLAGKQQLAAVDPAEWEAMRSAAEKEGLAWVLRGFYAARAEVLAAVSELTEADLVKIGIHRTRGPMSVRQIVAGIASHDLDHAQQIAKTRAAVEV